MHNVDYMQQCTLFRYNAGWFVCSNKTCFRHHPEHWHACLFKFAPCPAATHRCIRLPSSVCMMNKVRCFLLQTELLRTLDETLSMRHNPVEVAIYDNDIFSDAMPGVTAPLTIDSGWR